MAMSPAGAPKWGIFTATGAPVIMAQSVVDLDFAKDWRISDFPTEPNSFVSANKVETPYEARLTFAQGGTEEERNAFLAAVKSAVASTALYHIVMPEFVFLNANLTHYDFRRRAEHGVNLLVVEVWAEQVRVTATQGFTNTKAPSGADPVNQGTVQGATPTPAQIAAVQAAPDLTNPMG